MPYSPILLLLISLLASSLQKITNAGRLTNIENNNQPNNLKQALLLAIRQDNAEAVEQIVDVRSEVNSVLTFDYNEIGDEEAAKKTMIDLTPLHLAAHFDSWRVAKFLIENGANLSAVSLYYAGRTPLLQAAARSSENVLALLISTNNQTTKNFKEIETGRNIFHVLAASKSGEKMLKMVGDFFKSHADEIELWQLLDETDNLGETPLHLAVLSDNPVAARFLLENGANCLHWDKKNGRSPLHMAAYLRKVRLVHVLMRSHRCDPDQVDACGLTFFDYSTNSEKLAENMNLKLRVVKMANNNNHDGEEGINCRLNTVAKFFETSTMTANLHQDNALQLASLTHQIEELKAAASCLSHLDETKRLKVELDRADRALREQAAEIKRLQALNKCGETSSKKVEDTGVLIGSGDFGSGNNNEDFENDVVISVVEPVDIVKSHLSTPSVRNLLVNEDGQQVNIEKVIEEQQQNNGDFFMPSPLPIFNQPNTSTTQEPTTTMTNGTSKSSSTEPPTTPHYIEYARVGVEMFNESLIPPRLTAEEEGETNSSISSSQLDKNNVTLCNISSSSTGIGGNNNNHMLMTMMVKALRHQVRNLSTILDAERMDRQNERDYVAINSRRQSNTVMLIEKAIKFTAILKTIATPSGNDDEDDAWIRDKLFNVDLHNIVQIARPMLPGQKVPFPPITKFVFTIYGNGLTASEAGRICKRFEGATLANIRSKFEADLLELPYEVLEDGLWIGLFQGPILASNISATAFWWSDGTPLMVLPEDSQARAFSSDLITFFHEGDYDNFSATIDDIQKHDNGTNHHCVKLVGGINTHLEIQHCDNHLHAALCELPFTKSWFTIALHHHKSDLVAFNSGISSTNENENSGFNWTMAAEECALKRGNLIDAEIISFRDDDVHLKSLLDPLMVHLAIPKLPYLVTEAVTSLSSFSFGEQCWIGLHLERRAHTRHADLLRWIDGSVVINSTTSDVLDWFNNEIVAANFTDENDDYCITIRALPSPVHTGKIVAKYNLLPCHSEINCALCQTTLPVA